LIDYGRGAPESYPRSLINIWAEDFGSKNNVWSMGLTLHTLTITLTLCGCGNQADRRSRRVNTNYTWSMGLTLKILTHFVSVASQ